MEGFSYYVPLTAYVGCFIAALSAIFVRTELGLIYLALFIPLQNILNRMQIFPLGNHFIDILVLSSLIGCFIRGGSEGKVFEKKTLIFPILLYGLFSFVSLLLGLSNSNADLATILDDNRLRDWKNLMELPVIYFISLNSFKDKRWMKLLLGVIVFSLFLTDISFYREFRWYKTYHYTHAMRVSGPFVYLGPNELGAFFAQYGVLLLALLFYPGEYWKKVLVGIFFGINFYCLMYSFSRAGYLAIPIGAAFVLFFKSKKLFVLLIVMLCLAPKLLPVSVMERIEMTTLSQEEKIKAMEKEGGDKEPEFDPSAQGRFRLWGNALEMFKQNPLFGAGYRTYSYTEHVDTHNNFLKILAELGIIGFLIYLYLYYLAFKSGWHLYRNTQDRFLRNMGLGFAGCVIANMVANVTHDNWTYINLMGFYWIIWGVVVRSNITLEKDRDKNR